MTASLRQSGFSLVSAIFVVVIMAALSAYMVTLSGSQHYTVMNALQGARAYQAARSGGEWAKARALSNNSCASVNNVKQTFAGHPNFSVTTTCTATLHTEGANTYRVFVVNSMAQSKDKKLGEPGYAVRRLRLTFNNAP